MGGKLYNLMAALTCFACLGGGMTAFTANAETDAYKEESIAKVKNVILMIGDGMGPNQIKAGEISKGEPLSLQKIEKSTYVYTSSANNNVTDSAAAATALATGVSTNNNIVGLNPLGKELETIMDIASEHGKRTGVVTTEPLHGATPMGFSAHFSSRTASNQLLESAAKSGVNLFISEKDATVENNMPNFTGQGYTKVENVADISEAESEYVIGAYGIKASAPSQSADAASGIAFDRVVSEALEYLSKDEDGFVLMAEGAKIDKGGHENNFETMLSELLAFDAAVEVALEWSKGRDDTVVIVTADHETGGLKLEENVTQANLHTSYSWTTTGHTATDVYCKVAGVDVDFTRYSSFGDAERIKNTDIFHFMKTLVLGRQEVEVKSKKTYIPCGKLTFDKDTYYYGETVKIAATPNENCELTALKVNGKDMLSQVVNNVLTYTIDSVSVEVDVTFKALPGNCEITYNDLKDKGRYELNPETVKTGEKLVVRVTPNEGYVINKVTFEGVEMKKTAENTFEALVVESGVVRVTFKEIEVEEEQQTTEEKKGCKSAVMGGGFALLLGTAILFMNKKRDN